MANKQPARYLFDSDVLINYFRKNREAYKLMKLVEADRINAYFSVISETELLSGVRNKNERKVIGSFLNLMERLNVDKTIAVLAGEYRNKYFKSHSLETPDALIAATAILNDLTLITENKKHFEMIKDLQVKSTKEALRDTKV